MAKVKFFSQKMIEGWASQGKVEFDGKILTIKVGEGGAYELEPASMFLGVIEGKDEKKICGKVLTEKHIQDLGLDLYHDSALLGEVAYKVEPGFVVAKLLTPAKEAPSAKPAAVSKEEPKPSRDLAALVLKALSE